MGNDRFSSRRRGLNGTPEEGKDLPAYEKVVPFSIFGKYERPIVDFVDDFVSKDLLESGLLAEVDLTSGSTIMDDETKREIHGHRGVFSEDMYEIGNKLNDTDDIYILNTRRVLDGSSSPIVQVKGVTLAVRGNLGDIVLYKLNIRQGQFFIGMSKKNEGFAKFIMAYYQQDGELLDAEKIGFESGVIKIESPHAKNNVNVAGMKANLNIYSNINQTEFKETIVEENGRQARSLLRRAQVAEIKASLKKQLRDAKEGKIDYSPYEQ